MRPILFVLALVVLLTLGFWTAVVYYTPASVLADIGRLLLAIVLVYAAFGLLAQFIRRMRRRPVSY